MSDANITGNLGAGVTGERVKVINSSIVNNGGVGIRATSFATGTRARLRARGCTVSGNSVGMFGDGVDPAFGFAGIDVRVNRSSVTGNLLFGVRASQGEIQSGSTDITGNGLSGLCGITEMCADIATPLRPLLARSTTCGTSWVDGTPLPNPLSWGVCSDD